MIEFTLKRNKNGKKSRWSKKYPRKRILRREDKKAVGWYFNNWFDDNYHWFGGDLHKFLMSNIGRPVDKVFSEFLKRCRRGTEKYNLREWFYKMFRNKENIGYAGGFYLSNGIINYKKREKKPVIKYTKEPDMVEFNTLNMPGKKTLYNICCKALTSHELQLLGTFYISPQLKEAKVYVATRDDYRTSYFYMNLANIKGIGIGVKFHVYGMDGSVSPYFTLWTDYLWGCRELPDYVFLIR